MAMNIFFRRPSELYFNLMLVRYASSEKKLAALSNLAKQAKMLTKLMNSGKKQDSYGGEEMLLPVSSSKSVFTSGSGSTRRYAVYNSVLMRHVTDVLSSGEFADEISGKGVHVTNVKVSSDFKYIAVHWLATEAGSEEKLKALLPDIAVKLRHHLTQLRVVGHVPKITFLEDKAYKIHMEVEKLLEKADYGEDYVPYHGRENTTKYFSNENKILADSQPSEDGVKPLPKMRNDVFGLNHEFIMSKVKTCVQKSYAPHRIQSAESSRAETGNSEQSTNTESVFTTDNERDAKFAKFIIKKRISQKVKNKMLSKKNSDDIDVVESYEVVDDDFKSKTYDEEDYMEEFDERYQK